MKHAMTLATLALAALVAVPGCGGKFGLLARCGVVSNYQDPIETSRWALCAGQYWKEYYARQAEEQYGEKPSYLLLPPIGSLRENLLRAWRPEWEEAKRLAKSPSPQSPRLAWLNGIWCNEQNMEFQMNGARVRQQETWQVLPPPEWDDTGRMYIARNARFSDRFTIITESKHRVEEKEGYFEFERSLYPRVRRKVIRKDSNDRYTIVYEAVLEKDGQIDWEEKEPKTYFRCEPVKE